MAPTGQERLAELEKIDAPVIEQIHQASLFAGIPTAEISNRFTPVKTLGAIKTSSQAKPHGRQEYVLRWLLKKLQDEETRRCTAAWRLLEKLIDLVPLRNLARVLNERKFVVVLRKALEEAVVAAISLVDDSSDTAKGTPVKAKVGSSTSKKRKRNGNASSHGSLSHSATEDDKLTAEWKWAVYEATDCIVQLSKPAPSARETSTSEYMKSAIRASGDEVGRILGAWLALCSAQKRPFPGEPDHGLLDPFLEIWDSRILGAEDAKVFSRHCLKQSLTFMSAPGQKPESTAQLEKLLARNIIVPARKAYASSKDADLLVDLVGDVVSRNPGCATVIFDTSIRCIQPHGSRPRAEDDAAWLQAVISALKEAMGRDVSEESVIALNQMLRDCIEHKIALELPFLRLITSQYGLPSGRTNWDLLATIIELDSNTFLIPSNPEDLLKDLLVRVTKASAEVTWPNVVEKVVDKVLAPLMGEFSKARQLIAFIHHWYDQLAEFDKCNQRTGRDGERFTAWEDEALRLKLKELLEPSLTTLQIVEVVDWLVDRVKECQGAACVLLDAVAGAISHEDTRTALHPTLLRKVINVLVYTDPDDRYKARLLHLNTVVLNWSSCQKFEDTSMSDGNSPLFLNLLSSEILFPDRDHSLVALEAFRYLCAQWSIGAPRFWDDLPVAFRSVAGVETLSSHIACVASHVRKVIEQIGEVRTLVEERWEGRFTTIKRGIGWLACAYASCILVEYPQVLELCMEGQMLTDFLWLASTAKASSSLHSEDPWLPLNHPGFPSLWIQMLQHDGYVENNPKISQNIINRMIECGTHLENPIEKSKACNGFVVMCFHHLPLELLSKDNREAILKAWPPQSFDPSFVDMASLLYRMAPLDPAVLSLKAKMFRRPTLYKGISFQELVDIAECIMASGREPKRMLGIFAEIPELILGHVFATIDQPKSLNYIQGVKESLESWLLAHRKTKKVLSYAIIRLVQVVLTVWATKDTSPDEISMTLKSTTEEFSATFRGLLLSNLQRRLEKPEKLTQDDGERCMSLYSTMDALDAISVGESDLEDWQVDTLSTLEALQEFNRELGKRFELFMIEHYPGVFGEPPKRLLGGDIATVADREAIQKKAEALTKRMTEAEKLQLVTDMLEEMGGTQALDKLLALKHIISSCEDLRPVTHQDDENTIVSLSSSYSTFATQLRKTDSVRQFWLICDILEMILHEKPRSITQYNIDATLASITIVCGRDGPKLNPLRASTIYHHLVKLVKEILTSHRLKLQGHFHVVIQTLQALLYCLFTPSPTDTYSSAKGASFPPWLTPRPGMRTLNSAHAQAYTRLLTLICDPSVSAVSRPSSAPLHSATKKAKALAGQHVPLVLSAYVRAQLDASLAMKQEVREALLPGWYAVLDTMTLEGRRALGEGLDASGRAILSGLVKDWLRFGKWDGS